MGANDNKCFQLEPSLCLSLRHYTLGEHAVPHLDRIVGLLGSQDMVGVVQVEHLQVEPVC